PPPGCAGAIHSGRRGPSAAKAEPAASTPLTSKNPDKSLRKNVVFICRLLMESLHAHSNMRDVPAHNASLLTAQAYENLAFGMLSIFRFSCRQRPVTGHI